jgi:hypothetical protein
VLNILGTSRFVQGLRRYSATAVGFVLWIAFISAALALGLKLIPFPVSGDVGTLFAVLIAAIGCSIATLLIAPNLNQIILESGKAETIRKYEDGKAIIRLKEQNNELSNALTAINARSVDWSKSEREHKLSLLTIKQHRSDARRQIVKNNAGGNIVRGRYDLEYLGVYKYTVEFHYGVDYEKLRFLYVDETDSIEVYGLKIESLYPANISFPDDKTVASSDSKPAEDSVQWLVCEVRSKWRQGVFDRQRETTVSEYNPLEQDVLKIQKELHEQDARRHAEDSVDDLLGNEATTSLLAVAKQSVIDTLLGAGFSRWKVRFCEGENPNAQVFGIFSKSMGVKVLAKQARLTSGLLQSPAAAQQNTDDNPTALSDQRIQPKTEAANTSAAPSR